MNVDQAWQYREARCIDLVFSAANAFCHSRDGFARNRNIGIDDTLRCNHGSAANYEIGYRFRHSG